LPALRFDTDLVDTGICCSQAASMTISPHSLR
jgi:hypothetical protein